MNIQIGPRHVVLIAEVISDLRHDQVHIALQHLPAVAELPAGGDVDAGGLIAGSRRRRVERVVGRQEAVIAELDTPQAGGSAGGPLDLVAAYHAVHVGIGDGGGGGAGVGATDV